jgi:hypothetical protein
VRFAVLFPLTQRDVHLLMPSLHNSLRNESKGRA